MEDKICKLCLKKIDTNKEDYICLTQYNKGSLISTGYYHTEEFKQKFMNFKKIQDDASRILNLAGPILKRANQGIM